MQNNPMSSLKDQLLDMANRIPETATWQDVMYEFYVRAEIERGLDDIRHNRFASDEQVSSIFKKHGVLDEGQMDEQGS